MSSKIEIDFIEFGGILWRKRIWIIKILSIFFTLGIVISLLMKKEYEARCKLLPEIETNQASGLGNLGSLAGLVGIKSADLGGSNTGLNPALYPLIGSSLPFQDQLLKKEYRFNRYDTTFTGYKYFSDIYRPALFEYILLLPKLARRLFKDKTKIIENEGDIENIWKITYAQKAVYNLIERRIEISVNDETGLVSIKGKMPDPVAAAEITESALELLTEHVINYKISKAKSNLNFIEKTYVEKKKEFEIVQNRLAQFDDKNRNVVTSLASIERQKLKNDYDVAFEVYKGISQQLQQARIKVEEETPVFTVIEPIVIPLEKSQPQRIFITLGLTIIGFFVSILIIFYKYFLLLKENSIQES